MSFSTFCMKKLNAFKYWHRIKRCVSGDGLATLVNFMVSCIFPLSATSKQPICVHQIETEKGAGYGKNE